MAARQDQTLQIALIVFAIFTVVLLGLTYWFYKQSSDAAQRIASLESDNQEKTSQVGNLQDENQFLRQKMGFDQFAERAVVEESAKADLDRMLATMEEEKRNYRDGLKLVYEENQTLSSAQKDAERTNTDLTNKLTEVEAGHKAQIDRLEQDKAQIEREAAAARNTFEQARAQLTATQNQLAEQIQKQTADFDKERADLIAARQKAEDEARDRQNAIDKFLEERTAEEFSFEIADGKVTWVNQANNTVWINIGSADSLRRQVTFSVYDTEDTDAGKAEKKGSIEVVRMLGAHMAECRVTNDDPRNPILPGDYIYSPIWHEGRPQHFALTGVIDMDGDGTNDLRLAKDLIELNGGVLDAYPNPETGEQVGEMTIGTRFLVYGEYSEKTNDSAIRDTWESMHDRANALGVELISLTDFMNQMGYKADDRSVSLGQNTNANDFRPRPAPGSGDLRPRANYVTP